MANFLVQLTFLGNLINFDWKELRSANVPDEWDPIGVINISQGTTVNLKVFYTGNGTTLYKFQGQQGEERDPTKWASWVKLNPTPNDPNWDGFFETDIKHGDPPIAVG